MITLTLTDAEGQLLAAYARVALAGDGHRPHPCPICQLALLVSDALQRAGLTAPQGSTVDVEQDLS